MLTSHPKSLPTRTRTSKRRRTRSGGERRDHAELRIGNLLDHPGLREAMGIDTDGEESAVSVRTLGESERRLTIRRLLEQAAA